jgi:D-arabinose 1-dehydrogenase-like Zn-dependent alcohol dehydrogenase
MGFERMIGGMLLAPLVRQRIVGLLSKPNQQDLAVLAGLITTGKVTPLVQPSYPLSSVAEAIEAVGAGPGPGTVVVAL